MPLPGLLLKRPLERLPVQQVEVEQLQQPGFHCPSWVQKTGAASSAASAWPLQDRGREGSSSRRGRYLLPTTWEAVLLPSSQAAVASLRFQFPATSLQRQLPGPASLTTRSDPYLPKSANLTTRSDPYRPKYDFLDAPRNFSALVAGHLAHRENILLR